MNLTANLAEHGLLISLQGGGGGAPVSAINAVGNTAQYVGTPPSYTPNTSFTASRQGFDSTGTPATIVDTFVCTHRIRQVYPNQASLTAQTVGLHDYIYSTDTIAGVTNNSTETSPVPIANWASIGRDVIGNTLTVDVVAFHRNARSGKPVACVTGTATDGTNTVTASSSTPIVLPSSTDAHAVIGYRLTFNTTSLNDQATITVNAKVYPHIGGAGSVLDSSVNAAESRSFSPIVFYKWVARAATPVYVVVNASTGVNATVDANGQAAGITKVSTTLATARLNPFQTWVSAVQALKAATNLTGGFDDGCKVILQGSCAIGSSSVAAGTYQNGGSLYIEGDPLDATATLTYGVASITTRHSWITIQNCNVARTDGVSTISSGFRRFRNVALNNNSNTTAVAALIWIDGMTITNGANGMLAPGASADIRLVRGVTSTLFGGVEAWCVLGCEAPMGLAQVSARPLSGGIFAFSRLMSIGKTATSPQFQPTTATNGFALVQYVLEWCGTNQSISALRPSGDGDTTVNMTHYLDWYSSMAGYSLAGRNNELYCDLAADPRSHRLQSLRSRIPVKVACKGDTFAQDGTVIGNWGVKNGAGVIGTWTQFDDDTGAQPMGQGSTFSVDFPGLKAYWALSKTVRHDPLYVDNKGALDDVTLGVGGGDYHLQSGSPCIGIMTAAEEALPFDLDGNARDRGSIGAYR